MSHAQLIGYKGVHFYYNPAIMCKEMKGNVGLGPQECYPSENALN